MITVRFKQRNDPSSWAANMKKFRLWWDLTL